MIKKIQKYLLLHYPVIWNIRLIPMLLILIAIHLLFFGIGYISTDTVFNTYYYYSPGSDLELLYPVCILVGILVLVGWLVFYSRNNGFRTFYPRKNSMVYLEWIMIFVITTGITFIPFSMTEGYTAKWRSVASLDEAKKAIETLDKANVLIPQDVDSYRYYSEYDKPIPIPAGVTLNADTLNLSLYETRYSSMDGIIIKGYIGPSLLFYKNSNYNYYYHYKENGYLNQEEIDHTERHEFVKKWLQNGQKDSIYAIMKDFNRLQEKHGLKIILSPDQWMRRIYNPPFFPVSASTQIYSYAASDYDYDYAYPIAEEVVEAPAEVTIEDEPYYQQASNPTPYLQFKELHSGYEQVLRYYNHNNDTKWIALVCLCFSLALSIFIFSFRVTGGKSWLIAFVATGVLIFTVILVSIAMLGSAGSRNEEIIIMIIMLFWIILFAALLTRILAKIKDRSNKGRSSIYMNLLLWLIPCIIPLLYTILLLHSKYTDNDYLSSSEDNALCMLWGNILFVTLVMWFVSSLVRRWKSIAEE